jgi:ABC-type dipeptide/oligopeptide/nickel transport system permease subunit
MLAIYPGLCILVTVVSVNILGDALRDAAEPESTT